MKIVLNERDFYFQKVVESKYMYCGTCSRSETEIYLVEKVCLTPEFKDSKLSQELCKIMYDENEEEKA